MTATSWPRITRFPLTTFTLAPRSSVSGTSVSVMNGSTPGPGSTAPTAGSGFGAGHVPAGVFVPTVVRLIVPGVQSAVATVNRVHGDQVPFHSDPS